jgi:hypothetical protein
MDDLSRALYAYLVDELYSVPAPQRARSRWVMNREWYDECCRIGSPEGGAATLLGLPYTVTADGGVPHLIAG